MAAGQEDELFLAYFDTLLDPEKEQTVRLLAEIERGRHPAPETRARGDGAAVLLTKMTFDGHRLRWLRAVQADLERDFTDAGNLARWAAAGDQPFVNGENYAQGYERAVTLYIVLARLGASPAVDAAWKYLLDRTPSRHLRTVLHINKGMVGIDPRNCEMIYTDGSDPDAPKVVAVPRRRGGERKARP
jgi:hypothetical protein